MDRFQLTSAYKPQGDQPKAIKQLVEGIKQGQKHQVLLGVTGSGKSLDGEEPVFVLTEDHDGALHPLLIPIGQLVDLAIASNSTMCHEQNGTVTLSPAACRYYVPSFSPVTGRVECKQVTALTRHQAPREMYRVQTACGREALLTGDHNLWVLREGHLELLSTDQIRTTDYLPLALDLPGPVQPKATLDTITNLNGRKLYVQAAIALTTVIAAAERKRLLQVLAQHYRAPGSKLWCQMSRHRGLGIRVSAFLDLLKQTDQLFGHWDPSRATARGKLDGCALPAQLPLNGSIGSILKLIGYFLAEGNVQRGYVIISNRAPEIRNEIERSLDQLGLTFSLRPNTDYQISSTPLAELLAALCGKAARSKHLPVFWPELSDSQLGALLQAYFDGDGSVERNEITCATASRQMASDLAYALLRFGIWARLRRVWKRATNSLHGGDWYWRVSVSGQRNLRAFLRSIGFTQAYKSEALRLLCARCEHSNVEVIPGCGRQLQALRTALGLKQREVAEVACLERSALSLIEHGKRNPQRTTMFKLLGALEQAAQKKDWQDAEWWASLRILQAVSQLRWTQVQHIESIPYDKPFVYDLSVLDNETFLGGFGGLFVHNTFTMANLIAQTNRPTLVLAPNKTLAAQLYTEFKELFPSNAVEYFVSYYDYYQPEAYVPQTDTYIEKDAAINDKIDKLRHSATRSLQERRDVIVVASVSCIYGLGSPEDYRSMLVLFQDQMEITRDDILNKLVEIQYQRNDMDFHRGTFRVRGDVVDIFPAHEEETAIRVEFFGDVVDAIWEIDPLRGEPRRRLPKLAIYPASHYVTSHENLLRAIRDIEIELDERLPELMRQGKLLEAQRLGQRTRFDLEMLGEMGFCHGIENYSRHLDGRQAGEPPWVLLDYFPDDYLLFLDESHVTVPQVGGMYRGDRSRKETLVDYGFRLPSALDNRPLNFQEFERMVNQVVYVSATPGPYELREAQGRVVEQIIRPTGLIDPEVGVRPVRGQVDDLLEEIRRRAKRRERVLVTTLTKRMAEELTEYYQELGVKVAYLHSDIDTLARYEIIRDLRLGKYDVLIGINLLREGLDIPEVSLVAILDADKEGFLRSERSLIQTIGRASRHVNGQVIMYADTMTKSLRVALDETNRRRELQRKFNEKHRITPESIVKSISDVLHSVYESDYVTVPLAADAEDRYLTQEDLNKVLKKLRKEMKAAADRYDFERAAELRDRIFKLEGKELELRP